MKKALHCEVLLLTPTGKAIAPLQITYDDNENKQQKATFVR